MKRKTKEKTKKLWKEIEEALIEKRTFTMDNNPNGYPTIWWFIAEYILRNMTSFSGYNKWLAEYAKRVANDFAHVKKKMEEKGINVYKGEKDSKKVLRITLDVACHNVKEHDELRGKIRVAKVLRAMNKECKAKGYLPLNLGEIQSVLPYKTQQRRTITGNTKEKK